MRLNNQKVEAINAALSEWSGADVLVYSFTASHRKLTLFVKRLGEREGLELVCIGCESMSGPFAWRDSALTASGLYDQSDGSASVRLVDSQSHFVLVCADLVLLPQALVEDLGAL